LNPRGVRGKEGSTAWKQVLCHDSSSLLDLGVCPLQEEPKCLYNMVDVLQAGAMK
jgi:hypothetical protein